MQKKMQEFSPEFLLTADCVSLLPDSLYRTWLELQSWLGLAGI